MIIPSAKRGQDERFLYNINVRIGRVLQSIKEDKETNNKTW